MDRRPFWTWCRKEETLTFQAIAGSNQPSWWLTLQFMTLCSASKCSLYSDNRAMSKIINIEFNDREFRISEICKIHYVHFPVFLLLVSLDAEWYIGLVTSRELYLVENNVRCPIFNRSKPPLIWTADRLRYVKLKNYLTVPISQASNK
jgi:hypothetical protein